MIGKKTRRQPLRLASKDQKITILETGIPVGPIHLAAKEEKPSVRILIPQLFPRSPSPEIQALPIVHTGPANGPVVNREAKRAHQVQAGTGSNAESGNITGIRGNFGFNEHHVNH